VIVKKAKVTNEKKNLNRLAGEFLVAGVPHFSRVLCARSGKALVSAHPIPQSNIHI